MSLLRFLRSVTKEGILWLSILSCDNDIHLFTVIGEKALGKSRQLLLNFVSISGNMDAFGLCAKRTQIQINDSLKYGNLIKAHTVYGRIIAR
jgi:hypothetical protein